MALADATLYQSFCPNKRNDTKLYIAFYGLDPEFIWKNQECTLLLDILDWRGAMKDFYPPFSSHRTTYPETTFSKLCDKFMTSIEAELTTWTVASLNKYLTDNEKGVQMYKDLKAHHAAGLKLHETYLKNKWVYAWKDEGKLLTTTQINWSSSTHERLNSKWFFRPTLKCFHELLMCGGDILDTSGLNLFLFLSIQRTTFTTASAVLCSFRCLDLSSLSGSLVLPLVLGKSWSWRMICILQWVEQDWGFGFYKTSVQALENFWFLILWRDRFSFLLLGTLWIGNQWGTGTSKDGFGYLQSPSHLSAAGE